MKFLHSIRGRLLVWYGTFLAVMLAGFGFTAWRLAYASRLAQVDQELQRRLAVLTSALKKIRGPEPGSTMRMEIPLSLSQKELGMFDDASGFYYAVWLRGDKPWVKSAGGPANAVRPRPEEGSPRQRDALREMFLATPPVDRVLVGKSMEDEMTRLHFMAWRLLGAGLALLALGLAGGWWIASALLRPVRAIAETARRISTLDLSRRINIEQTESELGSLAQLLNDTFARLESSFAQQARFTSDAAHELRTPLTVLLTQTQAALVRERSAGEYRDTLVAIEATGQRMRRLMEALLELARLDAGQEELRCRVCNLADIAADCAHLIQPLVEARDLKMEFHLAEASCHVDPERVAQVITNLLKNAVDYNRDHGSICLETTQTEKTATLTVKDTGAGLAPEHLRHVFDRFYRVDAARSSGGTRTGLGLAIAKAIVDAHRGQISIKSASGQGTEISVAFPRARREITPV